MGSFPCRELFTARAAGSSSAPPRVYGASNDELLAKFERTVGKRIGDFPRATHLLLFGEGEEVQVCRLGSTRPAER